VSPLIYRVAMPVLAVPVIACTWLVVAGMLVPLCVLEVMKDRLNEH